MKKHTDILGAFVTERVSGFVGVASLVCFNIEGSVDVLITPKA